MFAYTAGCFDKLAIVKPGDVLFALGSPSRWYYGDTEATTECDDPNMVTVMTDQGYIGWIYRHKIVPVS